MPTALKKLSVEQLGKFLVEKGVDASNAALFKESGIDGQIADTIDENHLKEMGISKIGDRLHILKVLGSLKQAKAKESMSDTIWKGTRAYNRTYCESIMRYFCFCIFQKPDEYILAASSLTIKKESGNSKDGISYEIDNVEMAVITDVDITGTSPSFIARCCGAPTIETLRIITKTADGEKNLYLKKGTGEEVATKIRFQMKNT
eukprot:CAMPEP_0194152944 /NCGR_PEP_ID=MMETSP0152-20130528/54680_1 /TAXON_ID=1049557 /ORGANISM="Thalassiothrix antarctica, Strain L6-D1" /LENGTH=203 /DNA_ID=CAMNT_0038857911 /DNA_START=29 /DNA_END=640 /DNA_ORIENTATION=-